MFGLDTISWAKFIIYDFTICIIIDIILVLIYHLTKKEKGESTDQIRRKKSQAEQGEDFAY